MVSVFVVLPALMFYALVLLAVARERLKREPERAARTGGAPSTGDGVEREGDS